MVEGGAFVKYIDHHAHMVSRTTDDYHQMALTGCVAVTEPAFWAGWDRSCADSVEDYYRQLTEFEPNRARQYGIQHYTWLAMNPKEADDRELSREVLQRIPKFLDRPTVLGIGEIGLNRITRNEVATYTEQVELAIQHDQLILIHTPHLEDKYKGTQISIDVLRRYGVLKPGRVLIDHAEEHTIEMILEHGYWAGLTLYPNTKISPQRAVDVLETHGPDRICVAGACDWGPSDSVAVPKFAMEMRRRHHPESLIQKVIYGNPVQFLSQSPKFRIRPEAAEVAAPMVA
jgi:predicted metal-dependent TIM-barrel fold hydrolase